MFLFLACLRKSPLPSVKRQMIWKLTYSVQAWKSTKEHLEAEESILMYWIEATRFEKYLKLLTRIELLMAHSMFEKCITFRRQVGEQTSQTPNASL